MADTKKRGSRKPKQEPSLAVEVIDHDRLPKGNARQVGSTLSRGSAMLQPYLTPGQMSKLIEYERASRTDETVGSGIEFMKLALIASIRDYYHPDPEIKEFVRKSLDEMTGTAAYAIGELAESALIFGYSVSEILWKLVDGKIQIDELMNYHPASIIIWPTAQGRLLDRHPLDNPFYIPPAGISHCGIWQLGLDGATYNHLPLNKVCLVTHGKRSGIYTGTSAIQRIYKNWKLKDIVLEMYNVALDRYGTPVTYAIVPAGMTPDMVTDPNTGKLRNKTIREAAEEALANMHRGTSLVFQRPSMQDDVKVDALTTGNNFGSVFLDAINYYNKAIYRGLLIPQLLLEEGSAGLSNPGAIHWQVFKLMIQAFAKEIIEPFCEQVIGRMIQYNFKDTRPGQFIVEPFDPAVSSILATVFDKLVKNGYLNPGDQDDLNEVRELFGLPTKDFKPVVTSEDQRSILRAPADKIKNDKIKADAAMVKSKASELKEAHGSGAKHELDKSAHDLEKKKADREHQIKQSELDLKKKDMDLREKELKEKQKVDKQKMQLDHEAKIATQQMQHEQNMLAIKKGYVAQPTAQAPTASKAPKVSNKTTSKPAAKPKPSGSSEKK